MKGRPWVILMYTLSIFAALFYLGLITHSDDPTRPSHNLKIQTKLSEATQDVQFTDSQIVIHPTSTPHPTSTTDELDPLQVFSEITSCLASGLCEENSSYDFSQEGSVEKLLNLTIESFESRLRAGQIQMQQALTFAGILMRQPQVELKTYALRLFRILPRNSQSLTLLLEGGHQVDSTQVMEEILDEVSQYGDWSAPQVEEFIKTNLVKGSFVSSPTVAKHVSAFLTPDNFNDYADLLEKLPKGSTTRKNLSLSLASFRESPSQQ
jgi:hypothetical protein